MCFLRAPSPRRCWIQNTSRIQNKEIQPPFNKLNCVFRLLMTSPACSSLYETRAPAPQTGNKLTSCLVLLFISSLWMHARLASLFSPFRFICNQPDSSSLWRLNLSCCEGRAMMRTVLNKLIASFALCGLFNFRLFHVRICVRVQ